MKRTATWAVYAAIPFALYLQFFGHNLVLQFVVACLAVLPLAAWIGASTEQLAHRIGPTYGAPHILPSSFIRCRSAPRPSSSSRTSSDCSSVSKRIAND